jgi:CRP-like cAMP-binding protein
MQGLPGDIAQGATVAIRADISRSQTAEPPCLVRFPAAATIPFEAGRFWQVRKGLVKLSAVSASGDEVLTGWAQPAMVFALTQASAHVYHRATAAGAVELEKRSLQEVASSPTLALALLSRLRQSEELLAIAGQRQTEDRLRDLLVMLARDIGEPADAGTRILLRLTHQELANAIGVARVTVTLLLSRFRQQGWFVPLTDGHFVVTEKLKNEYG